MSNYRAKPSRWFRANSVRRGCTRWACSRTPGARVLVALVMAALLGSTVHAQYVMNGPPPPIVERPHAAPGRGYVWVPGYQRWDGQRYLWEGGKWVRPPRPAAAWMPGHWNRGPRGWFWVPGRWRG